MGGPMIHVGTSGWTYDDWSGPFYPENVRRTEWLSYYAARFDTVEINATFYRIPTQPMIDAWNRRLPTTFHLAVKGPRSITHVRRLKDYQDLLAVFLQRVLKLNALEVILWQLPPSLERDLGRLEGFLEALPPKVRHAVEFRHPSWWDEETSAVLRRHAAAQVAVSHPQLPDALRPTADFLYLRFHGLGRQLYRYRYSREELAQWASRLRPHLAERTLYAYFNNDFDAHAVANAVEFRGLLD